jgi:hypothetical protein
MSLYRKHAQSAPVKGEFSLTKDNIDMYLQYAVGMNEEINWLNHINDIQYKLDHLDELDDELYTESYLKRRMVTIKAQRDMSEDMGVLQDIKNRLSVVNREIEQVRPLVFDKVEGQKEEHHIRMSDLDDKRKLLEEELNDFYGTKYPSLKEHLPKVYYMIIDGCDINTVQSCFMQMKQVLLGNMSSEQAAGVLMDESTIKYNLPSTIWDPIRSKVSDKSSKKGKR